MQRCVPSRPGWLFEACQERSLPTATRQRLDVAACITATRHTPAVLSDAFAVLQGNLVSTAWDWLQTGVSRPDIAAEDLFGYLYPSAADADRDSYFMRSLNAGESVHVSFAPAKGGPRGLSRP